MYDVVIIGGGLSGLRVASYLEQKGINWHLLEARDRTGGRIYSPKDVSETPYDMGPAWIWPHQRRIQALAGELGLGLMPQYIKGNLAFEDSEGNVRRDLDFAIMGGTLRVEGGLQGITDGLEKSLPVEKITLSKPVSKISKNPDVFAIDANGKKFQARRVVLALPPRLAATRIDLSALMSQNALNAMKQIPTWMAAHGKVIATYKTPFWRERGLSGEGMSHRGPMMEIHDAGQLNGHGALFGFIHPDIVARKPDNSVIRQAVLEQFTRMFGQQAADPQDLLIKIWLKEPFTATAQDTGNHEHPSGRLHATMKAAEEEGFFFAGAEVAPDEPGLVEGALASAEDVVRRMELVSVS